LGKRSGATIRRIATVQPHGRPSVIWVVIETDDGLVGLGETYWIADPVAAYIHEIAAPYLLGQSAFDIQRHWTALYRYWGNLGLGAEARGVSALDIALWDLLGKASGLPLYQLLGGASRSSIQVYNTCGGPDYIQPRLEPGHNLYGTYVPGRLYEDLWASHNAPEELAQDLLEAGIRAMKILSFEEVANETNGLYITPAGIRQGLEPLIRIRKSVGDRMAVALELRRRWSLPAAKAIASAAEEYTPLWIEDPMRHDSFDTLGELSRSTRVPIVAGENLGARFDYRGLIERGQVAVVMVDPAWVGGVTEARRVADVAALYQRPISPHDTTGPVNMAVGVHMCINLENAYLQEIVRAFQFGWYGDYVAGLPRLADGHMTPSDEPGHGVQLLPDVLGRESVTVRVSVAR
jgi:galactonate dehydratase